MLLLVTLPDVFVAVIINGHDEPVNELNVAVPVVEVDGLAVTPLMVYVVVILLISRIVELIVSHLVVHYLE